MIPFGDFSKTIHMKFRISIITLILMGLLLAACTSPGSPKMILPTSESDQDISALQDITPYPTRPSYAPGELVDYMAQTGDTLPGLAARFNTTVKEIRDANPNIPEDATTMPPGMPMAVPIYYRPLWGTPFQIIPDAVFVNGPDAANFQSDDFIRSQPGWLRDYSAWAFRGTRSAAEIIDYVGIHYSISPKVFLTLLEYKSRALTDPAGEGVDEEMIMGFSDTNWTGIYLQLSTTANLLNDGYYRWREGELIEFELVDGSLIRPDPWQNAASVALQYFFSITLDVAEFHHAIGPDGFAQTYQDLFGDPWSVEPHIPGSLKQPELSLPYENFQSWAYTGGPHTGWGSLAPWAALDFAPPSERRGCFTSSVPTTAVADGLVVRDGPGLLMLDLDGDDDERTGWVIFYFHIAEEGRVPVGTFVNQGDPLGFPSCEGGRATGTHIHIARKYNGEWMPADGPIPFDLDGWRPVQGEQPYSGWLVREDEWIIANTNPDYQSMIPIDSKE